MSAPYNDELLEQLINSLTPQQKLIMIHLLMSATDLGGLVALACDLEDEITVTPAQSESSSTTVLDTQALPPNPIVTLFR